MSIRLYIEAMEQQGISAEVVLSALQRHSAYVEQHGLPAGLAGHTEHEAAIRYANQCRKLVEDEQNRRNRVGSALCGQTNGY